MTFFFFSVGVEGEEEGEGKGREKEEEGEEDGDEEEEGEEEEGCVGFVGCGLCLRWGLVDTLSLFVLFYHTAAMRYNPVQRPSSKL